MVFIILGLPFLDSTCFFARFMQYTSRRCSCEGSRLKKDLKILELAGANHINAIMPPGHPTPYYFYTLAPTNLHT